MKICTKCKIVKNESEFSKSKKHKDGLRYWCKECISNDYFIKKYGFIPEKPIITEGFKLCTKCKIIKNKNEFLRDKTKIDGLYSSCKKCGEKYRGKNKKIIQHSNYIFYHKNKKNVNQKLLEYKLLHPCIDCGEKNPLVLEFDHLGNKKFGIAIMYGGRYSWDSIYREIQKCVIRCVNCHLVKTHKEKQSIKVNFLNKKEFNKKCVICKKENKQFFPNNKTRDTLNYYCYGCQDIYKSLSLRKTRNLRELEKSRYVRYQNTLKIIEYLQIHPCVDCKETNILMLEFDHIYGKKDNDISNMIGCGIKLEKIFKEIEKCEIRCGNCHRIKTTKETKNKKGYI